LPTMYDLNLTEKLVLLAIMIETGYGRRYATTGRVYRRYVELSKLCDMKPVTQRRVYGVVRNLAKEGLLWARAGSFGRYGRTTVVKLLAPPSILCPTLVEDMIVGAMAEEVCRDTGR
jgi:Cdc6-like AAA superfamily ATPase